MDEGYFHGINKLKKPGYKIIKPPGGQTQINIFAQDHEVKSSPINACQAERNSSSIAFGNDNTPAKQNTKADRNSSSIVFGGPELPPQESAPVTPPTSNGTANSAPPAPISTPKAEPPPPTNNNEMHTPQQNDSSKNNAQSAVRSSTKVMAPPGGRSSINLFGP